MELSSTKSLKALYPINTCKRFPLEIFKHGGVEDLFPFKSKIPLFSIMIGS